MGVALLVLLALLWRWGPALLQLLEDVDQLKAAILRLGWFGPLALVALNALQILVAPIPGYVVQIAAGYLYGPLWGGIWGGLGLVAGSTLAMWLSRHFGRPLAVRMVGADRLERWERVTHSTDTLLWCVLLLGPTGDLPYFLAGLSKVSIPKLLAITVVVRMPSVFVAAAAGAGIMLLEGWQIGLVIGVLAGLVVLFFRYQDRLVSWFDRRLHRRLQESPRFHRDHLAGQDGNILSPPD